MNSKCYVFIITILTIVDVIYSCVDTFEKLLQIVVNTVQDILLFGILFMSMVWIIVSLFYNQTCDLIKGAFCTLVSVATITVIDFIDSR